jgi:uncharacterized protein (DUF2062 family)
VSEPPNAVPAEPKRTFWQSRVLDPVVAQLTQGITPEKIALTVAVGSSIAMFPLLGTTTLLCLLAGIFLKLNQPIIQVVNYLCTPLHIWFIFSSLHWGERMFGATHSRLATRAMREMLMTHPLQFMQVFSVNILHACFVWAIIAPFWGTAVYYVALPILREVNRVRTTAAANAAAARNKDHPVP